MVGVRSGAAPPARSRVMLGPLVRTLDLRCWWFVPRYAVVENGQVAWGPPCRVTSTYWVIRGTMVSWGAIAVISTILPLLGGAADRVLAARHRERLHLALVTFWCHIDDTRVPDLPKLMTNWATSGARHILGPRAIAPRSLLITLAASGLLTTVLGIAGDQMENPYNVRWPPLFASYPIYVVNGIFDLAAVAVTLLLLKAVRNSTSAARPEWSAIR